MSEQHHGCQKQPVTYSRFDGDRHYILNEAVTELKRWAEAVGASDLLIPEFYVWLFRHAHLVQHPSTAKYLFAVWLRCYDAVSTHVVMRVWRLNSRIFYKWMHRLCSEKIDVVSEVNAGAESF